MNQKRTFLEENRGAEAPRMYVIVNKDMGKKIHKRGMTKCYQHVQATHVVAQLLLYHPKLAMKWCNQTLIVLGTRKNQFMRYFKKAAKIKGCSIFIEPDLDNEITAFATVLEEKDFGIFKRLELL
jgi:hypothetical protein